MPHIFLYIFLNPRPHKQDIQHPECNNQNHIYNKAGLLEPRNYMLRQ